MRNDSLSPYSSKNASFLARDPQKMRVGTSVNNRIPQKITPFTTRILKKHIPFRHSSSENEDGDVSRSRLIPHKMHPFLA